MNYEEAKEICKKLVDDADVLVPIIVAIGSEGDNAFCGLNGRVKDIVTALVAAAYSDKHARQIILKAAELIIEGVGESNE